MGCINAKPGESSSFGASAEGSSSDVELNKQRETEHRLEVTFKTKRQNVFTAGVNMEDTANYKVKNIVKSSAHSELIRKCRPTDVRSMCLLTSFSLVTGTALNNIFIFAAMAPEDLQTVVNAMERAEIAAGSDVMTQGERSAPGHDVRPPNVVCILHRDGG